ncbi:hypothetical protein [Nocardioides sp. Arc9.136]|uniref:hypothetical protein n=1 Tax=Nocardioides sp. Arc9.136 TaxID=2996826 RepID=UPI0026658798|nr:hypothetical protein [Nocardioides sp. Arc9.136]WKN48840.1 hypothetical protein OSR43_01590 [Nocardioides sp. Arc9.136]
MWFEQELRDWEHQGVDARVVYLARPLLEGNTAQQREAHQLLGRIRDNWMRPGEAMSEVAGLLGRQGLPLGSMPKATDEELNEAWDGMSGSAGSRPTGDVSFGKSEKSERDAQTGGWVASPRD